MDIPHLFIQSPISGYLCCSSFWLLWKGSYEQYCKSPCVNMFSLFLCTYLGIELLSHRLKCRLTITRNYQTILQRVEPFYIHTIDVSVFASQRKICYKTKVWWHLSKAYFIAVPRVGKISVGIIWKEGKTANRREWVGTCQRVFTRKPAQGDHVGSRLHSYHQGCVLSWWHSFHMPGPLSVIQAIWAAYCFCSSCAHWNSFWSVPFGHKFCFLSDSQDHEA